MTAPDAHEPNTSKQPLEDAAQIEPLASVTDIGDDDLGEDTPLSRLAPFRALRSSRGVRIAGSIAGLALLVGALAMVWSQRDVVFEAIESAQGFNIWLALLLAFSVVVNVAMTGAMFQVLNLRYHRINAVEMQMLIAAATLLNYLPLRPGLIGRIAYHKTVHGIRLVHSVRVLIEASVISAALSAYFATAVIVCAQLGWALLPWIITPIAAVSLCLFHPLLRLYSIATLIRLFELFVWAVRYWLSFELIGASIGPGEALALAAISSIATQIPFISNGIGLREWAIGLTAPLLTAHVVGLGVTADLVNRAAELVVMVPVGLIAIAALKQRIARASSPHSTSNRQDERDDATTEDTESTELDQ